MAKKQRNKMKQIDVNKVRARYESKFEEFKLIPLDDLRAIFNNQKMSSTDRHALVMATDHLISKAAEQSLVINEISEKPE